MVLVFELFNLSQTLLLISYLLSVLLGFQALSPAFPSDTKLFKKRFNVLSENSLSSSALIACRAKDNF